MVVISRSLGSNRNSVLRPAAWSAGRSSAAASWTSATSVGSPLTPVSVTSAVQHRAAVAANVRARVPACAVAGSRPRQHTVLAAGAGAGGGPHAGHLHPVLGQGPGLVGADNRGGSERLDRGEPLDHRPPPGQVLHPGRQRQGDGG